MTKSLLNLPLNKKSFFLDWLEVVQAYDAIVYKSACSSAEATHHHFAETGRQPWQTSLLLKVSCHPNGSERMCCSLSCCSAAGCQQGWGVRWGNPEQVWHLLTGAVFTPTVVAGSGTCWSTLLCWGPFLFTVTLDNLDHVKFNCVLTSCRTALKCVFGAFVQIVNLLSKWRGFHTYSVLLPTSL